MKVRIELDMEQTRILREALAMYARAHAGQFDIALENLFYRENEALRDASRDLIRKLESCSTRRWTADNDDAIIAFQCMMSLRRFLWEQKPEDQRNYYTVESDRPVPYGEHNPPTVNIVKEEQT